MKKQLLKEISIILSIITILIWSYFYPIFNFKFLSFINIDFSLDSRLDLMFNLFTVQAAISTLSVSIIAIITGFQKEQYYGVNITHYITSLKPILFKHKNLMISELIITGINYFFVSKDMYNMSVAIFVVSIIISVLMIIDISKILGKPSDLKKEIEEYIIANNNPDNLALLGQDIQNQMVNGDSMILAEDLTLLENLYRNEVHKTSSNFDIIVRIEKIISKTFSDNYMLSSKSKIFLVLETIQNIYHLSNNPNHLVPLNIWDDIFFDFSIFCSTITPMDLVNNKRFNYLFFGKELIKNRNYGKEKNKYYPENNKYAERFIVTIYENTVLKNLDKDKTYAEIMKHDILDSYLYGDPEETEKCNEFIVCYCLYLKSMIDNNDTSLYTKSYLKSLELNISKADSVIFIVIYIYLYYLANKEPLVDKEEAQTIAKEILKSLSETFNNIIFDIDLVELISKKKGIILKILKNWEIWPVHEAKYVLMDSVVQELLFFTAINRYFYEDQLKKIFIALSTNSIDDIISSFFADDYVFIAKYERFQKDMFQSDKFDIDKNTVSSIKHILMEIKKDEMLNCKNELEITSEMTNSYEAKLSAALLVASKTFQISNSKKELNIKLQKRFFRYDNIKSTLFKSDMLVESVTKDIYRYISQCLVELLTSELNESNLFVKNNYDDEIYCSLFNESKKISPDLFIGNPHNFENVINIEELESNIYNLDIIKVWGPAAFFLSKNKVYFSIKNINVSFHDYILSDIPNHLNIKKSENNEFEYPTFNSFKVNFSEEELNRYLKRTHKYLIVEIEFEYDIDDDSGYGTIINK